MLPQNFGQLSAKEQAKVGLPEGFKLFTPSKFDGLNLSDSRIGMPDTDLFYLENFVHIGDYNLRTLWDAGTALYTAATGKTIVYFYAFNIGVNNYFAVFLNDGTAVQVNSATGAVTTISSAANTFYDSSLSLQIPVCGQWASSYLIIANNFVPNAYWVWDGSTLFTAGSLSPTVTITSGGSNYSSAPTVVAYGGEGTGATFLATVLNGSVVNIQVTNAGTGYEPGDQVQLYISGGGTDSTPELIANLASGTVSGVVITNPGIGYTNGTYALGFSGGGGTGATGTYTVTGNVVTSTDITAGGSGYTSSPTVSFPSGSGTGASGIAEIASDSVASVTVINGGTNLTGTPTISFSGGGGTGAVAVATVSGGSITFVDVIVVGSGYTSAPAVTAQSGLNNAAYATVSLMPYGISGTSIETFQSRVWIAYPFQSVQGSGVQQTGGTFNVSAPGSFTDFATSDGGLNFISTDNYLKAQYINLRQSNGYLYPLGDSSVSVISNVQTSGSPPSTTFNYQNTDPQIGAAWRDSCDDFSRTVLFGNALGVWGLYGGAVTKISKKLDSLFTAAIFPASGGLVPTAAVANVFSRRIFCMLMTFKDPSSQASVNKMVCWDEKDWFIASQTPNLTFIGTQEISSNLSAWGTDGKSLYPLFNTPSSLPKKLSTKLYGVQAPIIKEQVYTFAIQAQDLSATQSGVAFNVSIDTNFESPETNLYSYPLAPIAFQAPIPTYPLYSTSITGDVYAMNIGATVTTTSTDLTINFMGIGYCDVVAELALPGG